MRARRTTRRPRPALIGFTKSLAQEVGSRNITVNCVAPGFIDTDMTRALPEAQRDKLLQQIPLGRLGAPEDIAQRRRVPGLGQGRATSPARRCTSTAGCTWRNGMRRHASAAVLVKSRSFESYHSRIGEEKHGKH